MRRDDGVRLYIISTGKRMHPIRGVPQEWSVCGRSLREWQEGEARRTGIEVIFTGPSGIPAEGEYLLTEENLFFTSSLLKRFMEAAGGRDEPLLSAGIKESPFTHITSALQNLKGVEYDGEGYLLYPLFRVRGRFSGEWEGSPPFVPLVVEGRAWDFPMDTAGEGLTTLRVPLSFDGLMRIRHWIHLLKANILGLYPSLIRGLGEGGIRAGLRLVKAILLTGNLKDPLKWAERMNCRGKGVYLHPSAVVEGSILGDRVRVGANSTVRFSILMDGAEVEENGLVLFSVMGEGSRVLRLGGVKFSVLFPGASVGGGVQLSLLSRDSRVKYGGFLLDSAFSGDVRVMDEGVPVSCGPFPVGCCLGDGSMVGAGVYVAAGRAIPPEVFVVRGGEGVVTGIPEDLPPGTIWRAGGGGT